MRAQWRQVQTQVTWTGGVCGLGKRPAKGMEVWKEVDPEQETAENLFGNGDELYKDTNKYHGFGL